MKSEAEKSHKLKALRTQYSKVCDQLQALSNKEIDILAEKFDLEKQQKRIAEEIQHLVDSSKKPIISEHALLRYLERVVGVDLEEISQAILDEKTLEALNFGASRYHNSEGRFTLIVRNGVVVTIE